MRLSTQTSAALAALGLVGTAATAHAGLVTVPLDILPSFSASTYTVSLFGRDQFSYNGINQGDSPNPYGQFEFESNFFKANIASTGVNGVASVDPSLVYSNQDLVMAANNDPGDSYAFNFYGSGYVNVSIKASNGGTYYGYATFDTSNGELESITVAAPEPSTWALLITGAGALGIAAHRRRRRRQALVAA
jgi:hypothetical protein